MRASHSRYPINLSFSKPKVWHICFFPCTSKTNHFVLGIFFCAEDQTLLLWDRPRGSAVPPRCPRHADAAERVDRGVGLRQRCHGAWRTVRLVEVHGWGRGQARRAGRTAPRGRARSARRCHPSRRSRWCQAAGRRPRPLTPASRAVVQASGGRMLAHHHRGGHQRAHGAPAHRGLHAPN
jgi:hypothetical protein